MHPKFLRALDGSLFFWLMFDNILSMKNENTQPKSFSAIDFLWNVGCLVSIVGIWPRFIEPNLLTNTKLSLPIRDLPESLKGFKILQFSDLHINRETTDLFIRKLLKKIKQMKPDLIAFTGDFLCYSKFGHREKLKRFLNELSAPYGCYAILGNHDYEKTVSINSEGEYDLQENSSSLLGKAFERLTSTTQLKKITTERARAVGVKNELIDVIRETPFLLLNNETHILPVKDTFLNICGLGEYTLGRCLPDLAYKNYNSKYPGLILLHNPDGFPLLQSYPGDIVLCGHTHGGQVNLPWIWKKFTLLENMQFKNGLFYLNDKWLYVSRGIGSVMPFRLFAMPEIVTITLERAKQ